MTSFPGVDQACFQTAQALKKTQKAKTVAEKAKQSGLIHKNRNLFETFV